MRSYEQAGDRLTRVDLMRTFQFVVPSSRRRDAKGVVYGRRHVLGRVWIRRRKCTNFVRAPDPATTGNATACKENCLHSPPMIPSRQFVVLRQMRDLRRAAELASHNDQRAVEQPLIVQVVEQGGQGAVGW